MEEGNCKDGRITIQMKNLGCAHMDKKEQRRRQFHARGGGDTDYHRRIRASIDQKNEYLLKRGWKPDGVMLKSPYTSLCYPEYIARDVEDLRYYFRVSERRGRDKHDIMQGKVPKIRKNGT